MLHFLNCPEKRLSFWCEKNTTQVIVEEDSSGWVDITLPPEILKNLALGLFFLKEEASSSKCYVYEKCCDILDRETDPLIRKTDKYPKGTVETLISDFDWF